MKKDFIVNAGIRITRKCNMKCMYCNIQNTEREDLSLEEWQEALNIIKDMGVKDVVILGGEPLIYPKIVELVDYATNTLNLNCSLTTNGFSNFDKAQKLLDVGLTSLGVSVDNLNIKESISPLKAKNGLRLIDYLIENCKDPRITNYTVLNKNNVINILELIEYMNARGVYTYIIPFHWGNEGSFDHRRNNERFAFINENDIDIYNKTIDKIIALAQKGYKIKNSIAFLEESKKHIKNLDWKCNGLSELRIDSDGRMVCCCDKIGKVNDKFTIFDLKTKKDAFLEAREEDAHACSGCLWPSSFEAQLQKEKMVVKE